MKKIELHIVETFHQKFHGTPHIIYSPGRVNLIGEHTDYNNGFVLPAAIDKAIILAINRNNLNTIRLCSIDFNDEYFSIPVADSYEKDENGWANYIIGVVSELQKAGYYPGGFDCVFGGNIPIGAGLSSSAALEGGVAFGLSELFDFGLNRLQMAKLSQKAENEFVGVQCGIMDQFASLHGKKGHVIKLDCRSLEFERYPFMRDDVRIVLFDTNVRRELAGSEYNIRRQQCEQGVELLKKKEPEINSLRDVSMELLNSCQNEMDTVVYRRCRYVLEENMRVQQACKDLLQEDFVAFGEKMYRSHYGLRDDYEVSCSELDTLVEASEQQDGVLGARMMGGGFGGCTINLVTSDKLNETIEQITHAYKDITGLDAGVHIAKIGDGTHMPANEV